MEQGRSLLYILCASPETKYNYMTYSIGIYWAAEMVRPQGDATDLLAELWDRFIYWGLPEVIYTGYQRNLLLYEL